MKATKWIFLAIYACAFVKLLIATQTEDVPDAVFYGVLTILITMVGLDERRTR